MTAVSVSLPDDVSARLQKLADRTGRSKTYYMLEAINEHLDDLEEQHLAERRLRSVRAGRMGTVALNEVTKSYGLEG
jgi:RHH-type rel operon transcriptional repressor/antitoxin RelB